MPWRINFLRKVRYGTNTKQKDDIYDWMNTREGINDSLPAAPPEMCGPRTQELCEFCSFIASFYHTQTSRYHLNNPFQNNSSKWWVMICSRWIRGGEGMLILSTFQSVQMVMLMVTMLMVTMDSKALLQSTVPGHFSSSIPHPVLSGLLT